MFLNNIRLWIWNNISYNMKFITTNVFSTLQKVDILTLRRTGRNVKITIFVDINHNHSDRLKTIKHGIAKLKSSNNVAL